jgi:hypothetical protein
MTNDIHLIEALKLEIAALRTRVAELVKLLSAAQDACDKAETERQALEHRLAEQDQARRMQITSGPSEDTASR